jgi:hypothetical protein
MRAIPNMTLGIVDVRDPEIAILLKDKLGTKAKVFQPEGCLSGSFGLLHYLVQRQEIVFRN